MIRKENGLRILGSLVRKQEWDIAELQSGLARAKDLVEQLSKVVETLDSRIAETESGLRFSGSGANYLSVDVIQRNRRFLLEQHQDLARVLQERRRAEAIVQEFIRKLTDLRVQMRVYENLADRRRSALAAEEEKANMKQLDELWLTRVGG